MAPGAENDAGAGVSLAGDPGTVEGVGHQEEGHHQDEEPGDPLLLGQLAGAVTRLGAALLPAASSRLPVVLRLLLLVQVPEVGRCIKTVLSLHWLDHDDAALL